MLHKKNTVISGISPFPGPWNTLDCFLTNMQSIPTSSSALQSISCMQAVLHASIDAFPISNPGNWSRATRCFIVFEIESVISSTKKPFQIHGWTLDEHKNYSNFQKTWLNHFRTSRVIHGSSANVLPFRWKKKHMATNSRCTFLRSCGVQRLGSCCGELVVTTKVVTWESSAHDFSPPRQNGWKNGDVLFIGKTHHFR